MSGNSFEPMGLTPRALATRGFRDVIESVELRYVGVEPSRLYGDDSKPTDAVNGSRIRLMVGGRDIKVKVIGKMPDAFSDYKFGDLITLVDPEAILYARQGDHWPRVAFRASDVVKIGDEQGEEA